MKRELSRHELDRALQEFDRTHRGTKKWLNWESKRNHDYAIQHNGKLYPVKQIVSMASGVPVGKFSGGRYPGHANPDVEKHGLKVIALRHSEVSAERKLSPSLEVGAVYTREALKRLLNTTDATINTGIFQPAGYGSVMLFVTERKTKDRTQFKDFWDGTVLHWQGQLAGRKDSLVSEHVAKGLELLVFYRTKKYEFAGAGFRYLGLFKYVRHWGSGPASFVLVPSDDGRTTLDRIADDEPKESFDVKGIEDGRKKVLTEIVRRRGQPAFRQSLMAAYGGRCAITGCDAEAALEAAHIHPYRGDATNHVSNGLLLRADIHTLFDLGFLAIESKTMCVRLSTKLSGTTFAELDGVLLRAPTNKSSHPSKAALDWHYANLMG